MAKLSFTLRDDDDLAVVENAFDAVEDELDVSISRSRGRPAEDEITVGEAFVEIAAAYAGIDPEAFVDDGDGDADA